MNDDYLRTAAKARARLGDTFARPPEPTLDVERLARARYNADLDSPMHAWWESLMYGAVAMAFAFAAASLVVTPETTAPVVRAVGSFVVALGGMCFAVLASDSYRTWMAR